MAIGVQLSGVNFGRSLITAIPPVTDLRSMVFWGTGYDGNNSNRAPGGPAIVTPANAPALSSNYATVGQPGRVATGTPITSGGGLTGMTVTDGGTLYAMQPVVNLGSGANFGYGPGAISGGAVTGLASVTAPGTGWTNASPLQVVGGNHAFFDTQVTRASLLANGYTVALVARSGSVFGGHTVASNSRFSNIGFSAQLLLWDQDGFHGNVPTFSILENNLSRSWAVLPNYAGWRFLAATYTGGGAGTWMTYSLTDGVSSSPFTSSGVTAGGNQEWCYGPPINTAYSPIGPAWLGNADLAYGMVSGTAMTLVQLQALYASIKSIMARRGITC